MHNNNPLLMYPAKTISHQPKTEQPIQTSVPTFSNPHQAPVFRTLPMRNLNIFSTLFCFGSYIVKSTTKREIAMLAPRLRSCRSEAKADIISRITDRLGSQSGAEDPRTSNNANRNAHWQSNYHSVFRPTISARRPSRYFAVVLSK